MDTMRTNINSLLKELKARKALPKKMDVAKLGERHWFVCHDNESANIISETSSTGFSDNPSIALLKSLSERVERIAFRDGNKNSVQSCLTERSDGFAAYPRFYKNSEQKARSSALSEAIERYVWATWWDNQEIGFELKTIGEIEDEFKIGPHIKTINDQCGLEEIYVVTPKIENPENHQVIILLARLRLGGFISGGACGELSQAKETLLRAFDELYRHGLAIENVRKNNLTPQSFYEKRLAYFGFGEGNLLIRERLAAKGGKSVVLPTLKTDEQIPHQFDYLFCIHRCLFIDQPPFIGGHLERFCL
jgi:hypothetical protein